MMNHYNQVGVQKWSDLIAYGISRDEFNTVEIDEIVNVILYAYQGIRMWGRIACGGFRARFKKRVSGAMGNPECFRRLVRS